jgi:hypothetical protein
MSLSTLSPNRAVVFAVLAPIAYAILAMFVPGIVLRDVFNSLAFGAAVIIVLTWAPSAYKAVRDGADTGEWQLILAIFVVWFVTMCQRIYVIAFNWAGRPESWVDSPVSGFWPYSYMFAGLLFLAAPGARSKGIRPQALWAIIAAVALGSFVAGALFWASVSTG